MMRISDFSFFFAAFLAFVSSSLNDSIITVVLAQQSNNKKCDLNCPWNAPCVFGKAADFSDDVVASDQFGGLTHTNKSGMHCDCPIGWTGLLCDVKYESCSGNHECYHGGECVLGPPDSFGNEQLFCNCDNAEGFVGKYCETPIRDDDDHDEKYEHHDDKTDDNNDENNKNDNDNDGNNNNNGNNHNDPVQCGDGYCLNGGNCVVEQKVLENGTYQIDERCDCDNAYDEKTNSIFGGPFCQYKSTTVCVDDNDNNKKKNNHCFHHGICSKDNSGGGCECPDGWTGNNCEHKQQKIDIGSKICNKQCYNGGNCIQTEKLNSDGTISFTSSCDCSTARDDKFYYAGENCEFPSTAICRQQGEEGSPYFCVNHGMCMDDVILGCDCLPGFFGFKCELEKRDYSDGTENKYNDDEEQNENKEGVGVESCGDGLTCYNFGKCVTTVVYHQGVEDASETTFACDCASTGHSGSQCKDDVTTNDEDDVITNDESDRNEANDENNNYDDNANEKCGDDLTCHNLGRCVTTVKTNTETGTSETIFRCDCSKTNFLGTECQYPRTITDDENSNDNSNAEDNEENFECRLECFNGGKCIQGEKDYGFLHDIIGDIAYLNKTHAPDHIAHCECKEGWIGLNCEYRVEICDNKHVCLHGSKCVGDAVEGYSCTCDDADHWQTRQSNEASAFAGESCQYVATGTDICTLGDEYPGKPLYFCVNSGTCNSWVTGDQPNPGCSCKDGWGGTHCEIPLDGYKTYNEKNTLSIGIIVTVSSVAIVALVLISILIYLCIVQKEKQKKEINISSNETTTTRRRRRRRPAHHRSKLRKDQPIVRSSSDDSDGIIKMNYQDREQDVEAYSDEPSCDTNRVQSKDIV